MTSYTSYIKQKNMILLNAFLLSNPIIVNFKAEYVCF